MLLPQAYLWSLIICLENSRQHFLQHCLNFQPFVFLTPEGKAASEHAVQQDATGPQVCHFTSILVVQQNFWSDVLGSSCMKMTIIIVIQTCFLVLQSLPGYLCSVSAWPRRFLSQCEAHHRDNCADQEVLCWKPWPVFKTYNACYVQQLHVPLTSV